MVSNHVDFSRNSSYGRILGGALSANESADSQMADGRDMLVQMLTGPQDQDASYDEIVKLVGVAGYTPTQGDPTAAQLTAARTLFAEWDSAFGQTLNAIPARKQLYSKLRG